MDSRLPQHALAGVVSLRHPLGIAPGEITHMCPECGNPPAPLCPLCLGAGEVTTDRLSRYQAQVLREAAG